MLNVAWGKKSRLLTAMAKAFLVVFLMLINPFGLKTASQQHSDMLAIDLTSPTFKPDLDIATVVLIDEYTIERLGLHYPINYSYLSRLLRSITRFQPEAVFIDVLQHYEHSNGIDKWAKQLKKTGEKSGVFLAQDPLFDTVDRLSNRQGIRYKLTHSAVPSPVAWNSTTGAYPMAIDVDGKRRETASKLLYDYYCSQSGIECNYVGGSFIEPMVVRWNRSEHPQQAHFLYRNDDCSDADESYPNKIFDLLFYSLNSSSDFEKYKKRCFPFLTINAYELLKPEAASDIMLADAIRGRYIFLGYNLVGSNDIVISPIHGQLPGVFFHAASFVNLTHMGETYWKSALNINGLGISGYDIIQAAYAFFLLTAAFSLSLGSGNSEHKVSLKRDGAFYWYILLILFGLLIFLICYLSGIYLVLANWVAILMFIAISTYHVFRTFFILLLNSMFVIMLLPVIAFIGGGVFFMMSLSTLLLGNLKAVVVFYNRLNTNAGKV